MVHTVTVAAGANNYAVVAQHHAIEMATRFGARLRVVGSVVGPEEGSEMLVNQSLQELVVEAGKAGVRAEMSYRGEGMLKGLLAETRETDLLVIGMPTEGTSQDEGSPLADDLIEVLLREDLLLLRRSECSLLVVCRPPRPLGTILVNYQGGLDGKRALGMAGELAERTAAGIVVLTIEGDVVRAAELTGTAREYLGGFDLSSVDTIEEKGVPDSEEKILERAETEGADAIVIGHEPYGFLDRLLNRDLVEQVALDTHLPVLIVR